MASFFRSMSSGQQHKPSVCISRDPLPLDQIPIPNLRAIIAFEFQGQREGYAFATAGSLLMTRPTIADSFAGDWYSDAHDRYAVDVLAIDQELPVRVEISVSRPLGMDPPIVWEGFALLPRWRPSVHYDQRATTWSNVAGEATAYARLWIR